MTKRLITIVGANGVGKTTTSNALLQMRAHSAYVDADWCRAVNPFQFTEKTKETVTENIFCLFRNYLLCDDIETVRFVFSKPQIHKELMKDYITYNYVHIGNVTIEVYLYLLFGRFIFFNKFRR